jgi:hypothetical protein
MAKLGTRHQLRTGITLYWPRHGTIAKAEVPWELSAAVDV